MVTAMPSWARRLPWPQVSSGPRSPPVPGVTRPYLDAVPVRGPAQCRRECRDTTGQSRTDADHYRTYRRGVYRHAIAVLLWLAQSPLLVVGNCGMPFYIIVRSVEGLDGWNGRDLVSLHVMLGIGAPVMLYVQFRGQVGLLQHAAGDLSSPPPNSHGRRRGLKVP
jgi:hypothetical protein